MAFADFNIFQKMVDKAFRQNYAFPADPVRPMGIAERL